jgi:regulator of protease activity HflC (stomatin/prohibitin superfamily)
MTEVDTLVMTVGIAALALAVILTLANRKKLTVFEWQTALLYRNGAFKRTLGPGTYRVFAPPHSWLIFDRRPQFVTIPGQEVLTRDALGLKITLVAEFYIDEPAKLVRSFPVTQQHEVLNALYPLLQVPIREAASTYTLDEVIHNRDALPEFVRAACVERLSNAGIKLTKVAVRDIMIGKELRDAYAASAVAQKTAEATLERARSEVASMRALANAARMAQGNPELMQLRALQAMQTSPGRHSIVLDLAGKSSPAVTQSDVGDDQDVL